MVLEGKVGDKKVLDLKKIWPVAEAARFLSGFYGNEITEADVFRFALDDRLKLKLSIEIDMGKKIPVKPYKFTGENWVGHAEEWEIDFPGSDKKIKSLDGVTYIWGICGLPMRGGEVSDVSYEIHKNNECPPERYGLSIGAYVEKEGQVFQLQESTGDLSLSNLWRPAPCLPKDKQYIVLSSSLRDLIEKTGHHSEAKAEKSTIKVVTPDSVKPPSKISQKSNLAVIEKVVEPLSPGKADAEPVSNRQAVSESGYLRLEQIIGNPKKGIKAIIPVSKSTWWAGVKSGRYPKPVSLSERTTAWKTSEIMALLDGMEKGEG